MVYTFDELQLYRDFAKVLKFRFSKLRVYAVILPNSSSIQKFTYMLKYNLKI